MWGSWLDQIQKKLDDVSGLAEQAIDSMCEEVEEEEERMVEYKKEEGGENQSQTKKTSALRNDRDCNVSSYPPVENHEQQHQQQGVQERKLPVSVNGVTDQHSSPHEAVTVMTAMAMTGSSDGNSVLPCNIPATTVEEEEPTDHMVTAVEGTEEGSPLDVDPSSLQSIQHMETCTSLTAAAEEEGTEEKETKEEETLVASEPNPSTATTTSVVIASVAHPDDIDFTTQKNTVFVHDGNDKRRTTVGNSEEQLLRFQRMLADEMEVSGALREEKNRLDHRIVTLEKELASLKLFKKNALHADPQKLEALEREGMELSTKLGKERERYKALYEKKTQLESQVASLEKNIAQFSAREDDFQKRIAASHADCEAAKRRADDLNAVLVEQEDNVRQLQHQLASAKRSNAELVAQHKMELFQQKVELDSQKENSSGALVSLQRERDALVSSLRRDQMEYERRMQQLEDKLLQANRRADQAESRLTDHERSALAPIRELRATMEDMERQKKQLKEEVEYWKKECSLMERSRQDEKEQFTQQISDMKSELQVMHSERLTLEQELQQSKGKHIQTRSALEKALERASYAEAVKEQLALTLEETRRRIDNSTMDNNNNTNAPPHAEMGRISINAPPSLDGSGTSIRLPLYHMDPSEGVNDVTGRGGRSRVEREVVRQAVEIERLRRVEEEGLEAKRKLSALASQHDLLMQMYGQLREEFQQGQRDQSSK